MKTEKQWSEMTWQEKREERFKKWISTDDIANWATVPEQSRINHFNSI